MYTQEQILDMYFNRNQQAVSATSQMYGAKLTRFADTMIAHEDALECVNDTYIAAWNKIPPERPTRFLSWLYRVCRNIVCDRIDWNNASKRNSNMNCMLDELEECLADSNAKYEGELSDIGRCLSDFLNGLETEKRVLFVRRYWYGMTIDELADMSGRSKSSVLAILMDLDLLPAPALAGRLYRIKSMSFILCKLLNFIIVAAHGKKVRARLTKNAPGRRYFIG